ncbi:MAG: hypothetical protein ACRD9S_16990 [Pyrinomonadaceae bacterium]
MNSKRSHAYIGPALLILSAPCWWIGAFAFFSVVGSVYNATDSAAQIKVVAGHPTAWLVQNLCFLLGMLAAAGGLVTLTKMLRGTRGSWLAQIGMLTTLAATVAGVGVLYISLTLAERQTPNMPPMYSGAGVNPLHAVYGLLTLLGFVFYGLALVRVGLKWTGLISILLSSIMLVEVVRHLDAFPPLFFYTVPFILGVRLLFRQQGVADEPNKSM